MVNIKKTKGVIAILTGGGDVPGLNPAIKGVTVRAIENAYKVIGLRRGWAGISEMIRDHKVDNSENYTELTEEIVKYKARTGGTFLHTSRTKPSRMPKNAVPKHLQDTYNQEINDLTPEIIKNLEFLGVDYLIAIGGDDTLSYGAHLHEQGVKVIAIPKTMDNDVPGTDYCIGFSTCISRTISMTNILRTSSGSHERLLILEVFGRYAGFSAILPTMAGAGDRCVIPEHKFDIEHLSELLIEDRLRNPSKYAIVLVSEGAMLKGNNDMIFSDQEKDMFGHAKLGGIGEIISSKIKKLSPKFNQGKEINVINQRLAYLVRGGEPDAMDSIIPMAYGNLALDLVLQGKSGRLVVLKDGCYDHIPIDIITKTSKIVNVEKYYDIKQLRPKYNNFLANPFILMN